MGCAKSMPNRSFSSKVNLPFGISGNFFCNVRFRIPLDLLRGSNTTRLCPPIPCAERCQLMRRQFGKEKP